MSTLHFAPALELLLNADTWQKKRQILEQNMTVLCTSEAVQCLTLLAGWCDSNTEEGSRQLSFLISYRWLLGNVTQLGIHAAWAEFRNNIEEVR